MRIATWNVERLKHKSAADQILECCKNIMADIFVLTETDSRIKLPYSYCFKTPPAKEICSDLYRYTENRVSIYTEYDCIREYETYDKYTARCVELETERGSLIVYGTIMGIFGNREASYVMDLQKQTEDIRRLSGLGNLCVTGDYNCSFADDYYYTKKGRQMLLQCFKDCRMTVLTAARLECVDHIAVSDVFAAGSEVKIEEWNTNKALSDHKGIVADIGETGVNGSNSRKTDGMIVRNNKKTD